MLESSDQVEINGDQVEDQMEDTEFDGAQESVTVFGLLADRRLRT